MVDDTERVIRGTFVGWIIATDHGETRQHDFRFSDPKHFLTFNQKFTGSMRYFSLFRDEEGKYHRQPGYNLGNVLNSPAYKRDDSWVLGVPAEDIHHTAQA